jgi:hypothetical protein
MKTGPFLGWLGCMLWMLNMATSSKAGWIGLTAGIVAVALLIIGTVVTGVQKRRPHLGVVLSLLSVGFAIGFLIMFLVPEREATNAA